MLKLCFGGFYECDHRGEEVLVQRVAEGAGSNGLAGVHEEGGMQETLRMPYFIGNTLSG